MVDGTGNPNISIEYAEALGVLYSVAYALKFRSKQLFFSDYVVPPLEGLWLTEDMSSYLIEEKMSGSEPG